MEAARQNEEEKNIFLKQISDFGLASRYCAEVLQLDVPKSMHEDRQGLCLVL